MGKVINTYLEAEEKEIEEVFEAGAIPETEGKVVPCLFAEADGAGIALQREDTRRAEVKAGIAYEGWQKVSKHRYRIKDKTAYSGIMGGARFCEGLSLILAKKYDLSQIDKVIVGGDGAFWVKKGADIFGGLYELDRFHLKRALHRGLANDPLVAEIYESCISGEIYKADKLLTETQGKTTMVMVLEA